MRTFALLAELQVETNPDAPGVVATATGAGIGIFLLFIGNFFFRHVLTAVHEGGHALAFALFGAGVQSVNVWKDPKNSGLTVSKGPLSWLDGIVATALGYLAPPLAGWGAAELLAHGHADVVLWATAVAFGLLGLVTKNWFGKLIVFTTAFGFLLVARRAEPFYEVIAACTWAWMLITGGLQKVLDRWWNAGDFISLQKQTLIPELVWAAGYAWFIVVIAIQAGLVLVGAKDPFF